MTNTKIYGTHKVGFYLLKSLHCKVGGKNKELLGSCRAGLAGVGALYMEGERAIFESSGGIKSRVYPNSSDRPNVLKLRDLKHLQNAQSLVSTYIRRADFIESKMVELVRNGQFTDSTPVCLPRE
jgi:hypothetical protein